MLSFQKQNQMSTIFTTPMEEKEIYYYFLSTETGLQNCELEFKEVQIKWNYTLEEKPYGIKGIDSSILDITGNVHFWEDGDLSKEPRITPIWFDTPNRLTCRIKVGEFVFPLAVLNEMQMKSSSLYPTSIEFDFKNLKLTIS